MLRSWMENQDINPNTLTLSQLAQQSSASDVDSPMGAVNQQTQDTQENIKMDKFHIDAPSTQTSQEKLNFDVENVRNSQDDEDPQLSYWRTLLRSILFIIIALLIAGGSWIYMQYLQIARDPNTANPYSIYMQDAHEFIMTLASDIGISDYTRYLLPLTSSQASTNLKDILEGSIDFVSKKFILQSELQAIITQTIRNKSNLDDIQANTTAFGLLGQELYNVFTIDDTIISLQRSLLALEAIKFVSALRVFANLDTFIVGFAEYSGYEPSYVYQQMQQLASRNEQDIFVYLTHCYLNPYEITTDCNNMNELQKYYQLTSVEDQTDLDFFLRLMTYIDIKLEQTDVPSFAIIFQKFNPSSKEITFTVSVNTLQQDEAALINRGILNPHVHIVSIVINTLKQSRFVLGNSVDTKQLVIQPRVVRIGSNQITVNSSSMTFTLPIQQSWMTEIYDL